MAQPFLLSAQARTLSLKAIYRDTEEAAHATFRRLRWPETKGEPVCPPCGRLNAYTQSARERVRRGCRPRRPAWAGSVAKRTLSALARTNLDLAYYPASPIGLPGFGG